MKYPTLLKDSQQRLTSFVRRTPVLSDTPLDSLIGAKIFLKCENLQYTGSFKIRGATNAILALNEQEEFGRVVAHSSGNFAQAVAHAANKQNKKSIIVMPSTVSMVKLEATRALADKVVISGPLLQDRQKMCAKFLQDEKTVLLHPSNQFEVILGQSTAALEIFERDETFDYLLVPVGGGGLLAGTALAAAYFGKGCEVIGAEPLNADDAWRSLKNKKIEINETAQTIADGLRTNLGDVNFPIIIKHVQKIIRVSEEEIIHAMKTVWEKLNLIVEPSSAVPVAAVFKEPELFEDKKIAIIITGGNVALNDLPF